VKKENGRYIWITYWERSNAIKRSLELMTKLLERGIDAEAENIKGGIFSENIFIITPFTRRNGTKSFTCLYYPLKELEEFPQVFLSDYLKWKEQIQETALKKPVMELSSLSTMDKQELEDLRALAKESYRMPSGEPIPDEFVDYAVKDMHENHSNIVGQFLIFRYNRNDKHYTAGLITE
jgi:hypothetical protein